MLICGKYSQYFSIYPTDMSRLPDTYIYPEMYNYVVSGFFCVYPSIEGIII